MRSSSQSAPALNRISSLDGLRALAVLLPFVHALFRKVPGAWMSADVFFVLSGFFLTTELRAHRIYFDYWKEFFKRRALRLFPAMFVAFVFGALIFRVPAKVQLLYALSFADVGNALAPDLAHSLCDLWSVAVVIHFCLLSPFIVKYLRRSQLIALCIAVLIAEPFLRQWGLLYFDSFWAVYYLTPFRLDSFAAGALLALWLEDKNATASIQHWSGRAFIGVSLCLAALAPFGLLQRNNAGSLFTTIGYSLLAALSCSAIAFLVLHPASKVAHLLAWKPLAALGLMSYGFYLYHPLTIWLMDRVADRIHLPHLPFVPIASFSLSIAASWVSFHFYERRIMALIRRNRRSAIQGLALEPATSAATF